MKTMSDPREEKFAWRVVSRLRRFAEVLSRERTYVRRLPLEFGHLPIVVSPDSQLKYLRPGRAAFDATLLDAIATIVRSGDNVWDVGANVGVFTVASAGISRTGQFVAVEADSWLVGLLRRTSLLSANRLFDISVLPFAAYSHAGTEEFLIARRGRAANHLVAVAGSTQTGGERERVCVPTLPLDVLLNRFQAPHLVKIDVEGGEVEVLKGMTRTLAEARPRVFLEVASANQNEVDSIFERSGYRQRHLPGRNWGANSYYEPE